jgi:hypothetical protein
MSDLKTDPYQGTVVSNQHNKGRTWTDKGVLWEYTLTFKGAMPMKGAIRAQTEAEALALLKARHQPDEEAITTSIKVHGKSTRYLR